MSKVVICLAVLVQLAAALYYKPRPLVCPVSQNVQYQDELLKVTELEVLQVPLTISQIHLNTVIQTKIVPVTSVGSQGVSASVSHLQVNGVKLVHVTEPLTITKVHTVTSRLVHTQLNILTSTAINYITNIQSLPVLETFHLTVTDVKTRFVQLTTTVPTTVLSTVTVTKAQLLTRVVVKSVPVTTIAAIATVVREHQVTNTHNLTKRIIQTICPLPDGI